MAETLNKYATEEAYQADSHADSLDEVSLVTATGDVYFDGHNVFKKKGELKVGDAVYVDSTGQCYFVEGKTLDATALPPGLYPCGVVIMKNGGLAKLLHWNIISRRGAFISAYTWKFIPDGNPVKFNVLHTTSPVETVEMPVSFTATKNYSTDLAGYTAELDTWLRANQPEDANIGALSYQWHAAVMDDYTGTPSCYIISDNVSLTKWATYTTCVTGGTMVNNMYGTEPTYSTLLRKNGTSTGFAGYNKHYILSFYSTNTGREPTANMTDTTYGFAAKTPFETSEYCATLRSKYSTWERYVDSIMMNNLVSGNQSKMGGRELANSRWMAQQLVSYLGGTTGNLFPVGYYSVYPDTHSIVNSSFDWHLPSVPEAYQAFGSKDMLPDGIISQTLVKMGGIAWVWTNGNFYWLSNRYNITGNWELNESGRAGMFDWHNMSANNRYLSVADIE